MRAYVVADADAPLDALLGALREAGHEVVNDPRAPPPLPLAAAERQAFTAAVDRMLEADVLVADVSRARHDAGWAAAWFLAKGRLVVLCCRAAERARLSPLLAGNPSPWQRLVIYEDGNALRRALGDLLASR